MTEGQGAGAAQELVTEQNLVTAEHLVNRFRPLTDLERTNAGAWLDDAWEEIRGRVPNLDGRRASGKVTDGQLRRVLCAMVIRVLRNPEAIRQWTVDNDSFTRDTLVSSGLLYLSEDELSLLTGVAKAGEQQHLSFSVPYR